MRIGQNVARLRRTRSSRWRRSSRTAWAISRRPMSAPEYWRCIACQIRHESSRTPFWSPSLLIWGMKMISGGIKSYFWRAIIFFAEQSFLSKLTLKHFDSLYPSRNEFQDIRIEMLHCVICQRRNNNLIYTLYRLASTSKNN